MVSLVRNLEGFSPVNPAAGVRHAATVDVEILRALGVAKASRAISKYLTAVSVLRPGNFHAHAPVQCVQTPSIFPEEFEAKIKQPFSNPFD